ncbi:hypothetical protein [Mesorhizobium sp. B1-1-5]|uniref:hypothetical protein n=1 Tax=Mesorhizobium sp. B1-1-5 TaxID=2589979 RepID=UPI00112A0926|nr:hypothetical protein [Mesorhizobium sp. B1-1-5]TPO13112.1 hypothetical protein FJ980_02190 [Mesorhizobium sp. B1-1-5]
MESYTPSRINKPINAPRQCQRSAPWGKTEALLGAMHLTASTILIADEEARRMLYWRTDNDLRPPGQIDLPLA